MITFVLKMFNLKCRYGSQEFNEDVVDRHDVLKHLMSEKASGTLLKWSD